MLCSVVSESLQAPWTIAHQAPLSMGFSRQAYWSRLPFLSLDWEVEGSVILPMSFTISRLLHCCLAQVFVFSLFPRPLEKICG